MGQFENILENPLLISSQDKYLIIHNILYNVLFIVNNDDIAINGSNCTHVIFVSLWSFLQFSTVFCNIVEVFDKWMCAYLTCLKYGKKFFKMLRVPGSYQP